MSITKADLIEALKAIDLKEALREELDIHSAFIQDNFLREGIDAHFNCGSQDVGGQYEADLASKYWTRTTGTSGQLVCPATKSPVSIYSKRAFSYPHLCVKALQIPVLTGSQFFWIGFETGGRTGNLLTGFYFRSAPNDCTAVLSSWAGYVGVGITNLLPANYHTVNHEYAVELMKWGVGLYIDGYPVAYGLSLGATEAPTAFTIAGPPYAFVLQPSPIPSTVSAFTELSGVGVAVTVPMSPMNYRVSDGIALPPKALRLYNAGTTTKLAGLAVNPNITSHPFPIHGYDNKTVHFMANGAGTLNIEVLMQTNNWRTYDSLPVVANTLLSYIMEGEATLARVLFTPAAPPATISDAEVSLR